MSAPILTRPTVMLRRSSQTMPSSRSDQGRMRKTASPRQTTRQDASMSPIKMRLRAPPYCSGGSEKGDLRSFMKPRGSIAGMKKADKKARIE